MLSAIFGREIWNWYHQPEIELKFETEYPFLVETDAAISVRVKVVNKGKTTAKKCEARLEKAFDVSKERTEVKDEFEKLVLPWVGYPYAVRVVPRGSIFTPEYDIASKEWVTIDIAKGMDALFDICYVVKNKKRIHLVTSIHWPINVKYDRNEQKLLFRVSIYGENFKSQSKDIVIDVDEILKKFTKLA